MLKGVQTSGKMACHNFKSKRRPKIPPDKWTKFSSSLLLLLLRSTVKALAWLLPSLAGVFSRTQPMIIGNSPKLVSWTPKSWNSRAETGSLHHLQILKFPHTNGCSSFPEFKNGQLPHFKAWLDLSGKPDWKIDLWEGRITAHHHSLFPRNQDL